MIIVMGSAMAGGKKFRHFFATFPDTTQSNYPKLVLKKFSLNRRVYHPDCGVDPNQGFPSAAATADEATKVLIPPLLASQRNCGAGTGRPSVRGEPSALALARKAW